MKPIVVSVNEWVYPDRTEYATASCCADLHAPRGGYAAAQILLPGTKAGLTLKAEMKGLPFTTEVYRMVDVAVQYNEGSKVEDIKAGRRVFRPEADVREAPYRVYDCLAPIADLPETGENMTALYVAIPVPVESAVGAYNGELNIYAGDEVCKVQFTVNAHKAVVPEKGRFHCAHWTSDGAMAIRSGAEVMSDEWFAHLKMLVGFLRRARQNMCFVSFSRVKVNEDATEFDFTDFNRVMRAYLDAGMTYINFGHLIHRQNYHWQDPLNKYVLFCEPHGKQVPANTPEGHRIMARFLTALRENLQKEGIANENLFLSVGDEPTSIAMADYVASVHYAHEYLPGVPVMDAISGMNTHDSVRMMKGVVDIPVPINTNFQDNREAYEEVRAAGSQIWDYTCCGPIGASLNRLLDAELMRARMLFYSNYLYDLKGYLHWSYSSFDEVNLNPFEDTHRYLDDGTFFLAAGDSHIAYPDKGHGYWMSIRAEKLREGIEDYELLCQIADQDKEKADALCQNVVRAVRKDFCRDVQVFDANYLAILEAADAI